MAEPDPAADGGADPTPVARGGIGIGVEDLRCIAKLDGELLGGQA